MDGSQKQSHLYLLILPPNLLSSFLSSLPVSSFSLSTIWLVEDQERILSTIGVYFPIDSQLYGFHTRLGRVQIEEVYQVLSLSFERLKIFRRWRDLPCQLFKSMGVGRVRMALPSPSFTCLREGKTCKATFSRVRRSTSLLTLWWTWTRLSRAGSQGSGG